MTPHLRRPAPAFLLLSLLLVAGALVNLVPFVWTLSTSLKTPAEVFSYPPTWLPDPIAWGNYARAFEVVNPRVFLNSALFSVSIVLLQGLVTTMGGFGFARLRFPAREPLFLLYLGTMMIPPR